VARGAVPLPSRQRYEALRVVWRRAGAAGGGQEGRLVASLAAPERRSVRSSGSGGARATAGQAVAPGAGQPAAGAAAAGPQQQLPHATEALTGTWDAAPRAPSDAGSTQKQLLQHSRQHAQQRPPGQEQQGPGGSELRGLAEEACASGFAGLGAPGIYPYPGLPRLRLLLLATAACLLALLAWQALRGLPSGAQVAYGAAWWLLQAGGVSLALVQLLALWHRACRAPLVLPQLMPEGQFPRVEVLLLCGGCSRCQHACPWPRWCREGGGCSATAYAPPRGSCSQASEPTEPGALTPWRSGAAAAGGERVEVVEAAAVALLNINFPGAKLVLQLLDMRGRAELHRLTRRLQFQCK
jgi:hypothetical protein